MLVSFLNWGAVGVGSDEQAMSRAETNQMKTEASLKV